MDTESHDPKPPRADAAAHSTPAPAAARAGPLRVARAVLWSFFGVRRRDACEADVASITPLQAIIGGLIGALLLVAALITLVLFVTR